MTYLGCHWNWNVHLHRCHSIISFLIIFQLSFTWKGKNILIGWRDRIGIPVFCGFDPGLITVLLDHRKGKEFPNWALDHFTRHAFYVLLPFHPLSAAKQCKLSLTLECTSARMLFKLSHLIKLMVLRSSVKSGPRLKMHHQFNSLFAVWYLRWVWWAYTTKNSYLFRCPLWVTKIIINFIKLSFQKISFQIGLVKSSTYC